MEVREKKRLKMPHPTASGQISGERFKRVSRNFANLSGTASRRNLSDMTSLAVSDRVQNAIKYYTKLRKTGDAGIESRIIG